MVAFAEILLHCDAEVDTRHVGYGELAAPFLSHYADFVGSSGADMNVGIC